MNLLGPLVGFALVNNTCAEGLHSMTLWVPVLISWICLLCSEFVISARRWTALKPSEGLLRFHLLSHWKWQPFAFHPRADVVPPAEWESAATNQVKGLWIFSARELGALTVLATSAVVYSSLAEAMMKCEVDTVI